MVKPVTSRTFEDILKKGADKGMIPVKSADARKWYRQQAKKLSGINGSVLIREDKDRLRTRAYVGEMVQFFYDPKHKDTLPYYDSFPLIFKIEEYDDRFLGINLHYLPLPMRAKLMDALYSLSTDKKYNEKTKLAISYGILKAATKYKMFKPCIKMYLKAHVRSRFLKVNSNEWDIALFLPTAAWNKAGQTKVWADSRKMI